MLIVALPDAKSTRTLYTGSKQGKIRTKDRTHDRYLSKDKAMARPSAATLIREGEHLAALASETVEHLMARQPVGEVPECAPGWNQAFISAVREVKNRYRNSPDPPALLRIVSEKLYGREIHWALELIQNAEDEGAHRIVFIFRPDEMLVFSDGEIPVVSAVFNPLRQEEVEKEPVGDLRIVGWRSATLGWHAKLTPAADNSDLAE
jgi:hypothetical protein